MLRVALLGLGAMAAGFSFLPNGFGFLIWAAFVPLMMSLRGAGRRASFFYGWIFGTLGWTVGMFWFAAVVTEYGAGAGGMRFFLFLGIVAYLGLMLGVSSLVIRLLADSFVLRGFSENAAIALASLPGWVAVDGYFPRLFPAPFAATQLFHLPILQSTDLFGSAGAAFLIAAANAGIFLAVSTGRVKPLALTGILFFVNEIYGITRMIGVDRMAAEALASGRFLDVALLQASVPFSRRVTGQFLPKNLIPYRELSEEALLRQAGLIVWPQNAYERRFSLDSGSGRLFVGQKPAEQVLSEDMPSGASVMVTAMADVLDGERLLGKRYVSVLKSSDERTQVVSFKRFPTPLSEYWPLGNFFPFLYGLTPRMNRILPGPQNPFRLPTGQMIGVFVCYDGMREESARELTKGGAELLINPSSDQWSRDKTTQPYQSFSITRLRAIENRRFLFRSTPNGLSTVVDPSGRVRARLEIDEKGLIEHRAALLSAVPLSARLGPFFYRLSALAVFLILAWGLCKPAPRVLK